MKRRETINSNAERYAATVYEDAGRVIVVKRDTKNYYDNSTDEEFQFESVADYEAWKAVQDWIVPKKTRRVAAFAKVPQEGATPQSRYDAANTTQVKLKLNDKTDMDILKKLEEVENKQGYIKALIRADMAKK